MGMGRKDDHERRQHDEHAQTHLHGRLDAHHYHHRRDDHRHDRRHRHHREHHADADMATSTAWAIS